VPLARSRDAGFVQRIALVLFHLLRPGRLRQVACGAEVIVARNLEMLVLAAAVRDRGQRLVYECLDIHRLMLRGDIVGRALRLLERRLLERCDLVLVSSPAYRREYFEGLQEYRGEVLLIENKVIGERAPPAPATTQAGPPWRIGWFGMLRCRRSLDLLCDLAGHSDGRVEVLIAGKPSPAVFDDFENRVAGAEGVTFTGPYRPQDLAALYRGVHFSWCIDWFEEGLNSSWLLPNRLYESIANGAVPLALEGIETGRWLARAELGLRVGSSDDIARELGAMTPERFTQLSSAVARFPRGRVAFERDDHAKLVRRLAEAA
jgi:succinoglycan biosynthesis protein ExoL